MSMPLYILDCSKNQLKKNFCEVFSDASYSLPFFLYTFSTLLIIPLSHSILTITPFFLFACG